MFHLALLWRILFDKTLWPSATLQWLYLAVHGCKTYLNLNLGRHSNYAGYVLRHVVWARAWASVLLCLRGKLCALWAGLSCLCGLNRSASAARYAVWSVAVCPCAV
jgi:hypothetical protein